MVKVWKPQEYQNISAVINSDFKIVSFRGLKLWSYLERTIKVLFLNPIKPINPMKVFIPSFHGGMNFSRAVPGYEPFSVN